MADIQSAAAEIRRGKKEERRRKNKPQHENIMVCRSALLHRATIKNGEMGSAISVQESEDITYKKLS